MNAVASQPLTRGRIYTVSEMSAHAVYKPSTPDTRPQNIRDAQAAMETAIEVRERAVEMFFICRDEAEKRHPDEKKRAAEDNLSAAKILLEDARQQETDARVLYHSLMKHWSDSECLRVFQENTRELEARRALARKSNAKRFETATKGLLERMGLKSAAPAAG